MGNMTTMFYCESPVTRRACISVHNADRGGTKPQTLDIKLSSQNWTSCLALRETGRDWHQYCLVFRMAHRLLVISHATGPTANDIEINFPIILDRFLAFKVGLSNT